MLLKPNFKGKFLKPTATTSHYVLDAVQLPNNPGINASFPSKICFDGHFISGTDPEPT